MSAKLIVLEGSDKGREFSLTEKYVTIGSDSECGISLSGESISSLHAAVSRSSGTWTAKALDSKSLLRLDGRSLPELRLRHGSEFGIGSAMLRFESPTSRISDLPLSGKKFADPEEAVRRLSAAYKKITQQVGRVIVGQSDVVEQVLTAMFSRGHCLLIGVPGLAKTLLVRTLAGTLDLEYRRIQFTPDLMPTDIIGTDILEEDPTTGKRVFRFTHGPVFTNLLLADEINRTPPKTQAALLEAMQERSVTAGGVNYELPAPFFVLATQNPIEQEGTYPLPEAQLDRFMFCVNVGYPSAEEEEKILMDTTADVVQEVEHVLHGEAIEQFQHLVRSVPVSPHVARYAASIARATRPGEKEAPDCVNRYLRWGAGPRAGQYLLIAAKAYAILQGRFNVSCADVRRYALPVLRHRVFCNFAAASEGVNADKVVTELLKAVAEPRYEG